ncbi:MAG: electron transfer flavoprotein subunit beta/FixA family protein [bacterium]|nr:electron transfer flavoprotein subunit beta/FixA family protein [bacterium]
MKVLVTVKRVTDYETKLKVKPDGSDVVTDGVSMIANPFDEIAVEEALRLVAVHGGEVCVASVGTADSMAQIRSALAMGADRGILVLNNDHADCDLIAQVLAKVVEKEKPDLVLMGKQAVDDDSHQVAELLAEYLNYGQATQANKITVADNVATVVREADGGLETIKVKMPCIVTTDLRLNEPRYASLPGIMKAKKKPVEEIAIADLNVDLHAKVLLTHYELPPKRQVGQIVPDVATLIAKLQNEAKVL